MTYTTQPINEEDRATLLYLLKCEFENPYRRGKISRENYQKIRKLIKDAPLSRIRGFYRNADPAHDLLKMMRDIRRISTAARPAEGFLDSLIACELTPESGEEQDGP